MNQSNPRAPTTGAIPAGVTFPRADFPVAKIAPQLFMDTRGVFCELHRVEHLRPLLGALRFVQGNISKSNPYVIRGMHYQIGPCGKLLRCVAGSVFQVSVDVRDGSDTFGQFHGEFLSGRSMDAMWVPPGFANGFMALEDGATVLYEMTAYFDARLERQLAWDDETVGIRWPMRHVPATVSQKDRAAPKLAGVEKWRVGG